MRIMVKFFLQGVLSVLFGLDSTLVASSEAIIDAIKEVLESRGLTCSRAEIVKMHVKPNPASPCPSKDASPFLFFFALIAFPNSLFLRKDWIIAPYEV